MISQTLHQNIAAFGWRSPECAARYEMALKENKLKPLLEEPRIQEWQHWVIIKNSYPYDLVFEVHDMLIPKRVASRNQLTQAERDELETIMEEIQHNYDRQIINFPSLQSITDHFHIHLAVDKKHDT